MEHTRSFRGRHRDDLEVELEASPGEPGFRRAAEALTGAATRIGNGVQLYRNGDEIFPAMLDAIRSASSTIVLSTFVYWEGAIGREFSDALRERLAAGVEVRIVLDAVGCVKMDTALIRQIEAAGGRVVWFRPPRKVLPRTLNRRSHRKVLVVDGTIGFTGGVGIADEWTGNCESPEHWRDTHCRFDGPIVRDLHGAFQEHWIEATSEILPARYAPDLEPRGDIPMLAVRSVSATAPSSAETLIISAISTARSTVNLTTAYFAPTRSLLRAMRGAAERGVRVRLLVPGEHTDRAVVRDAGRRSYEALLESGVDVHEYDRTMLHAKVITIDGAWSSVGSVNLDGRSFRINDELNVSMESRSVARQLDAHLEDDLADAHRIELAGWRQRGVRERVREALPLLLYRQL